MEKSWGEIFCLFLMFLCGALLVGLVFMVIAEEKEMERQHCVKTGNSRDYTYIQFIYGAKGQIIGSYPVNGTEYEYTCDDKMRWH